MRHLSKRILSMLSLAAGAALVGVALVGSAVGQETTTFTVTITNNSDPAMQISPGAYTISTEPGALWSSGGAASAGLKRLLREATTPSLWPQALPPSTAA